jgi:hypothetical protein
MSFDPVPLPPGGSPAAIIDGIAGWTASPALAAVLAEFGHKPVGSGSLADRLADLDAFAAERWNYRKGLERHQAVGEDFPPGVDARLRDGLEALGFLGTNGPRSDAYDHVLVLGGGIRTMMARTGLAASVLSTVETATVAGIGSVRELVDQEETAERFGLAPCPTEGDAVDETLRHRFRLGRPAEIRSGANEVGRPFWIRSYAGAPAIHVLAAAATRPGQRANTADGFVGWASLVAPALEGARLLLVTTDIFVPFQHCDALRTLAAPYGCQVETIGFDSRVSEYIEPTRTFAILQEARSALSSMLHLHTALSAG